jgi:hypothetical protein
MDSLLKVLITLLTKRLAVSYEKAGLLTKAQAGFREREECVAQGAVLYEIIRRRKIKGLKTYALFLDFQKAFDVVPHGALFRKLKLTGVSGTMLQFIMALYAQSQVAVRTGDEVSEPFELMRGVRQGCPMSALLFIIFINDIFASKGTSNLGVSVPPTGRKIPGLIFADDTIVLADNKKCLAALLIRVQQWSDLNEMTFGVAKCGLMVFSSNVDGDGESLTRAVKDFRDKSVWHIGGVAIPVVSRYTYLGMLFTNRLSLRAMVDARISAGDKSMYGISNFLKSATIPVHVKTMVLKGVVIPAYTYGCELWGMSNINTRRVQLRINRAMRWIIDARGKVSSTPIEALRRELKIPLIAVTCAMARLRAFAKYHELKTWVKHMVQNPLRLKHRTWVTQSSWWINSLGLKWKVGPLSGDNGLSFFENFGQVKADAAAVVVQRNLKRSLKDCKTLSNYIKCGYVSLDKFQWTLEAVKGYSLITKFRIDGYWNYSKLAENHIIGRGNWCPCCGSSDGETLVHIVLFCKENQDLRDCVISSDLEKAWVLMPPSVTGAARDQAVLVLLLGGEAFGQRLPDWVPPSASEKHAGRETDVLDLETLDEEESGASDLTVGDASPEVLGAGRTMTEASGGRGELGDTYGGSTLDPGFESQELPVGVAPVVAVESTRSRMASFLKEVNRRRVVLLKAGKGNHLPDSSLLMNLGSID